MSMQLFTSRFSRQSARYPPDSGPSRVAELPDCRRLLRRIIGAYDSTLVRAYCAVRFQIINVNMLHLLSACLRGKRRVLEVGCGFGLFGCYFSARDPRVQWYGLDQDSYRIDKANKAAARLGLHNTRFLVADVREPLQLSERFDAVVMMDLLHHIPDDAKRRLVETSLDRLAPDGVFIIKDVTRRPWSRMAFTWLLDVLMTRGFDMWYWSPEQFRGVIDSRFAMETYPIHSWLPYSHIVYVINREPIRF